MNLVIVGCSTYNNYAYFKRQLETALAGKKPEKILVGGDLGVDDLAQRYATEKAIPLHIYRPDWFTYGAQSIKKRNERLVENCNYIFALVSKSSQNALQVVELARTKNINVTCIEYK